MTIPDKHFYTIGDVSEMTKVKPHVLRYWESHFKFLRPARRYSGHRKYSPKDIDLINRIRYLVVDRKFTLSGARREIHKDINPQFGTPRSLPRSPEPTPVTNKAVIADLKKDVEECLRILGKTEKLQGELF